MPVLEQQTDYIHHNIAIAVDWRQGLSSCKQM